MNVNIAEKKKAALYLASSNAHKVSELKELLKDLSITVEEAPTSFAVDEDQPTFAKNALKKAQAFASHLRAKRTTQSWVLADDSGLEVDALGNRPGVRSARFGEDEAKRRGCAIPPSRDEGCRQALLNALCGQPREARGAQLRCVLVLLESTVKEPLVFEGILRGHIAAAPQGTHGFGYDSLFVPEGGIKSLAERTQAEKSVISHRGIATRLLKKYLRQRLQESFLVP